MAFDKEQTEMACGIIDMEIERVKGQILKFRAAIPKPNEWQQKTMGGWEEYLTELNRLRDAVIAAGVTA